MTEALVRLVQQEVQEYLNLGADTTEAIGQVALQNELHPELVEAVLTFDL